MAAGRSREVRYPVRVSARVTAQVLAGLERLADAEGRPLGDVVREVLAVGAPIVAKRVESRARRARRSGGAA